MFNVIWTFSLCLLLFLFFVNCVNLCVMHTAFRYSLDILVETYHMACMVFSLYFIHHMKIFCLFVFVHTVGRWWRLSSMRFDMVFFSFTIIQIYKFYILEKNHWILNSWEFQIKFYAYSIYFAFFLFFGVSIFLRLYRCLIPTCLFIEIYSSFPKVYNEKW